MSTIPPPPTAEARALLAAAPMFQGLPAEVLDEIAAQVEWRVVDGGETVCTRGERGDCMYLVASGRLAVLRDVPGGEETVLREVGRGETVGELSIVTSRPRNATVRALRDSVLVRLSRERVDTLVERYPAILVQLTHMLAEWLEARSQPMPTPASMSLAVVAAGAPGAASAALADLARQLAAALAPLGPTLVLNAARVDAQFGAGAAASPEDSPLHRAIASWMNEQEGRNRFVVYQADPAAGAEWAERCVRQADRVLVVAEAAAEPTLGAIAPTLAPAGGRPPAKSREELVLLHPDDGRRPAGAAGWLALHPFRAHHHLRRGRAADVARLARLVSGRGVGLVLGGGGARGLAHIGVLRALEEAGVPVDRIAGASMGAMIAAQWARGYSWQEMVEVNRRGWVEMAPHKVYTLPVISVLSKVKAERMLAMMYGEDQIEDLWTSFFCVSTNLTRTEVVVHRSGLLRRALAASITIPGVTPPVVGPDGDLLVDGGVLNNLPTDVMRRLGDGPIVASDVSARVDLHADPSWQEPPTPWQFLSGRLRRAAPTRPFPNILQLIMRAALLASDVYAKQAKGEVDLYFDLPMDPFDMFDMERLDEIVEFGYQYARQELTDAGPALTAALAAGAATPPPAP